MSILDRITNWLDKRELSSLRRELSHLCLEFAKYKNEETHYRNYLESRDKLCSSLANTVNKQAFEIARLRGIYSETSQNDAGAGI